LNVEPEDIQDIFAGIGPVSVRRMFGARGVFQNGALFALVVDGTVYLKAKGDTVAIFEKAGSEPLTYLRAGKTTALPYWRAPIDALDDADEMTRWARLALSVASPAKARRRPRP
jgi:DNA transformation protein and related proteins